MRKDMFGRELKIGDIIAWPGRSGSSLWMNLAVVRGFSDYEVTTYSSNDDWRCGEKIYTVKKGRMSNTQVSVILSNDTLTELAGDVRIDLLLKKRNELLGEV